MKRKDRPKLYCVVCGQELSGNQIRFCGKRCKNKYHRERERERRAKAAFSKGTIYVLEGDKWVREERPSK